MPKNTKAATTDARGFPVVHYRNARGKTSSAQVAGGTGTVLNLKVYGGGGRTKTLTGIAKATAPHQTNVWY